MFGPSKHIVRKLKTNENVEYKSNDGTHYFNWDEYQTKGKEKGKCLKVVGWEIYPYGLAGMKFHMKGKNITSFFYFYYHQELLPKDITNYFKKLLTQLAYEETLYVTLHYQPVSEHVINKKWFGKENYCPHCKQMYSYYSSERDHSRTVCQQILFILQVLKQLK